MLDADDCLTDDALDLHLSWHLNSRVPVAFTAGRMLVIDELGRQIAGCLDNVIWLQYTNSITELCRADAYCRPSTQLEPSSAWFINQLAWKAGEWFWGPTSSMMFRRNMMEILLPDSIEIGAYGGDTYFAFAAHAFGGSILIDKHVGSYRRHGGNGYSDTGVYGAGTIAQRSSSSNWEEVASALRAHVQSNLSRFSHQIRLDHIERVLAQTATLRRPAQALQPSAQKKPKNKLRHKVKRAFKNLIISPQSRRAVKSSG